MPPPLALFVLLRLLQQAAETALARLNRRYSLDPGRLAEAGRALGIDEDDMGRAVAYSGDRHRFALVYGWTEVLTGPGFLAAGGLGVVERWAHGVASPPGLGAIATGLAFFGILALLSIAFAIARPFRAWPSSVTTSASWPRRRRARSVSAT